MADNTNEGNNDYVQIIQNAQNVLEHLETLQNKIREYSNKNASMKESYELIAELTLNLSNVCKQLNETSKSFRKSGPEEISTSLENLTNEFTSISKTVNNIEHQTSSILGAVEVLNNNVEKNLKRKGFLL